MPIPRPKQPWRRFGDDTNSRHPNSTGYFLGMSEGDAVWSGSRVAAARSKVPFGELAKRVGNGAGDSQCDRSVSNRVQSEAITDGVHSAIGGPARHTSLAAGAARLFRKGKWKLELQLRALLEIRYRDRQERDGLLTRMLREHRAHQFFGDLGKDCRRRNRRVERYGTSERAQVGGANPDRHRSGSPRTGPALSATHGRGL